VKIETFANRNYFMFIAQPHTC